MSGQVETKHQAASSIGKDFPKGGRPRVLDASTERIFRGVRDDGDLLTLRSIQNVQYMAKALKVLCDLPMAMSSAENTKRFGWLLRPNEAGVSRCRSAICYQLGRTKNEEALKVFADKLCALKPIATTAVIMLRKWQSMFGTLAAFAVIDEKEITVELIRELARKAMKLHS